MRARLGFVSILLFAMAASAAPSGVTYQGRILKPDGSPLEGANVQFRMQIRTPNSNDCLMYEELQALDMRNKNGAFSLTMADGTGSRMDTTGLGLDRIFANRGAFSFSASTCTTGSSYTPSDGDGRNLVVLFKDETMSAWEPIPTAKINYVPYAFSSQSVQGYGADSLLRVVNASSDPITGLAPLSNAQYTALLALANGSSTAYTKAGELNGATLPTMSTGDVLAWNGTTWVSSPVGAPGANSITTTMLQNSSVTGAKLDPAISIATSGTIASAISTTRDFKIFATSPSTFYVGMLAPALSSSYTLTWPLTAGSSGQVLTTNGSGTLSWTTPSSAGITDLTGDVTASGPGSAAATVATVGGYSAANVAAGATLANAASASNIINTIVRRDGSGNFTATDVTTSSSKTDTLKLNNAGSILNIVNPIGGAWTMTLPATPGSSGQVLTTNGAGVLSWATAAAGSGDFMKDGSVAMTGDLQLKRYIYGGNTGNVIDTGLLAGAPLNIRTADADLTLRTINGNNISLITNSVERIRISSLGNVGIGTTSANGKLEVNGSFALDGSTSGYTGFQAPAAASNLIYTLPATNPTAGQVLSSTAAGVLSWTTPTSGGATTIDDLTDARTTSSSLYLGSSAANGTTTAADSVAIGAVAMPSVTTGSQNVAIGKDAAYNLTNQTANTIVGWSAGYSLALGASGSSNTLIGARAGFNNSGNLGTSNTGVGETALLYNDGSYNTAIGQSAMNNTTGNYNTAVGSGAMYSSAGSNNVAVGYQSGYGQTSLAQDNVLIGKQVMFTNGTGNSGKQNTIVGSMAYSANNGHSGSNNVIVGYGSAINMTSGARNTLLGSNMASTLTTGSNNILIGTGVDTPTASTAYTLNIGNVIFGDLNAIKVGIGTSAPNGQFDVKGSIVMTGSTSGYTGFKPAAAAGSTVWTLPAADGTSGQVLSTNGSGVLSWATVSGGGSNFAQGGNSFGAIANLGTNDNYALNFKTNNATNMTLDALGNVGIGTTSPTAKLTVVGDINLDNTADRMITLPDAGFGTARNLSIVAGGAGFSGGDLILAGGTASGFISSAGKVKISGGGGMGGVSEAVVLQPTNGLVGIGTTAPAAKLDVIGTISTTAITEGTAAFTNSAASYTIPDMNTAMRRITLTNDTTITLPAFTSPTARMATLTIMLRQDATGGRNVTWAANGSDVIKWDLGTAPVISATAGKTTIIQLMKPSDEAVWYGSMTWKEN